MDNAERVLNIRLLAQYLMDWRLTTIDVLLAESALVLPLSPTSPEEGQLCWFEKDGLVTYVCKFKDGTLWPEFNPYESPRDAMAVVAKLNELGFDVSMKSSHIALASVEVLHDKGGKDYQDGFAEEHELYTAICTAALMAVYAAEEDKAYGEPS